MNRSITSDSLGDKGDILVLGAGGRIGRMLRRDWPSYGNVVFASRQELNVVADRVGLQEAMQQVPVVLCLAGGVPGSDLGLNVAIAKSLVDVVSAMTAPPRVLLASSSSVYGATQGLLSEATPVAPVNDYGRSKVEMEQVVAGSGITCLRIGNVTGADALLGKGLRDITLDQFSDGTTPRRKYISPLQIAEVMISLSKASALPEILNVGTPHLIEMGELAAAAGCKVTHRIAPIDALPAIDLNTSLLCRFHSFGPDASQPKQLLRHWGEPV